VVQADRNIHTETTTNYPSLPLLATGSIGRQVTKEAPNPTAAGHDARSRAVGCPTT